VTQYTFNSTRFGVTTKVRVNGLLHEVLGVDFGSGMIAIRVAGRRKLQWLPHELCELVEQSDSAA
jgi:hypothetical protein